MLINDDDSWDIGSLIRVRVAERRGEERRVVKVDLVAAMGTWMFGVSLMT